MSNIPWLFVKDTTTFKNLIEFMVATNISHDHYNHYYQQLIRIAPDATFEATKSVILMCGLFGECSFLLQNDIEIPGLGN